MRVRHSGPGRRSCSRLLKKAHLLRWLTRALVAAYLEYASLGPACAALHLDLFEQPGHKEPCRSLSGVATARSSFLLSDSNPPETTARHPHEMSRRCRFTLD